MLLDDEEENKWRLKQGGKIIFFFLPTHLSQILLHPTSTSLYAYHSQHPSPPHWGSCASPLHMPQPSHLASLILSTAETTPTLSQISLFKNHLFLTMPTHPSQHPHFRYFQLLNVRILDRLILLINIV